MISPHSFTQRILGIVIIVSCLLGTSYVIRLTGGLPSAYANLYYIPIALAALLFGVRGGLSAALAASLIALLPEELTESIWAWGVRCGSYVSIGTLTGWFSQSLWRQVQELSFTTHRLQESLVQTAQAFVSAVDAKHPYTANHSQRVAEYAVDIARELGFPETEIQRIHWAALLHDVGKLGISPTVLDKKDPLSAEDWLEIKAHPLKSERIVSQLTEFSDLLPAIRGHHEAWDGTGYPDQLSGKNIHRWARIIAVADAWDAMITDRSYRLAFSMQEALERLLSASGSQFDPSVVAALVSSLRLQSSIATPNMNSHQPVNSFSSASEY